MKIALLGYGKEGKSTEAYFRKHHNNLECDIFENFTREEITTKDFSSYDYVFRSPSVPPLHLANETSITKYFFDRCPCPIIGVTATKGKGTTCSFIKSLLDADGADAYLVGNIGSPALDSLDKLSSDSVVVYELSSFQLWDLQKPPHIAIVGTIEPDHLNVHSGYDDYINAKTNICRYQTTDDYLIYYSENPESAKIASNSSAQKIPYPFDLPSDIAGAIKIPGIHNKNNAIAAIAAVACYKKISTETYIRDYKDTIIKGLSSFTGLPHRLEFLYEVDSIKYYDDNFSTNPSSTRVAVDAFPESNLVIITGGRDKTNNQDLPEIYEILQSPQIKSIILMGESGHELAKRYNDSRFILAESLEEAVNLARQEAKRIKPAIILMSPAAASFDMFENVYDRGTKFQALVKQPEAK